MKLLRSGGRKCNYEDENGYNRCEKQKDHSGLHRVTIVEVEFWKTRVEWKPGEKQTTCRHGYAHWYKGEKGCPGDCRE